MAALRRNPAWSGAFTAPMADRIPSAHRRAAIVAIKAVHSAAFFSIASLIILFAYDGICGRPRRRTAIAAVVAFGESAIFATNNQVCPLTPLVEELGAERGSVTDIFLPEPLSRCIPMIFGSILVAGILLNLRAMRSRHGVPGDHPSAIPEVIKTAVTAGRS